MREKSCSSGGAFCEARQLSTAQGYIGRNETSEQFRRIRDKFYDSKTEVKKLYVAIFPAWLQPFWIKPSWFKAISMQDNMKILVSSPQW